MARDYLAIHGHLVEKLSGFVPHFDDLFDEESFYIFAICLTLGSILVCFLLSKKIKLEEVDY